MLDYFSFISPAMAQAGASPFGFDFMSVLPLVLIFVVFYFFLIRPQQKKAQQQKEMISAIRRGDRIVTSGGLIGTVTKVVNDQELQVEIDQDVKIRVVRSMVTEVISRGAPVSESTKEEKVKTFKKPATKKASTSKKKTSR